MSMPSFLVFTNLSRLRGVICMSLSTPSFEWPRFLKKSINGGLACMALATCMANETAMAGSQKADPGSNQQPASSASDSSEKKEEKPKFLRIEKDGQGEPKSLQTAITSYTITKGPHQGTQVDLIGAVHIAHSAYFQDLNRRFRKYDALLYELVADPEVNIPDRNAQGGTGSPVSAIQGGMKNMLGLQFQLEEIDYKAKNFVHADMSPGEFAEDMQKRGDGFLAMFTRMMGSSIATQSSQKGQDVKMLAALFSANREVKMRQAMAEQFENMEMQMAGLADASGRSTLLTERNRKAFEVLSSELQKGKKKIGVFYGAAHLTDMHERLVRDFSAEAGATEWLTAWNLQE
jgi:hypothetical protein